MKKKPNKTLIIILIVLVLPAVSLFKYALYEISGVRNAVGKTVILPEEADAAAAVRKMMGDSNSGTLENARYRWNDKVGFFDLEVQVAYEGRHVSKGLSPFDAIKVKVQDPQQPAAQVQSEGAPSY